MNITKVKINRTIIYAFVLSFIAISRCFTSSIFPSSSIEYIVLIAATIWGLNRIKKPTGVVDMLWLLMPIIVILNHAEGYSQLHMIIFLCAVLSRYILRVKINSFNVIQLVLLTFSIVTATVTWISLISPGIYINIFLPFLNDSGHSEVIRQLNLGNLCGLTDHYSRNAYYVTAGLMVCFSRLWGGTTKKKTYYTVIAFEFVTLLAIGKRGHLIFLLSALYIVYMLMQPSLTKKMKRSLKALAIVVIAAIAAYYFIPSARRTFERFLLENSGADFSNGRFTNYALAFSVFLRNPIFGIGYGGFRSVTNNIYAGVHNDYIQFLCETGVVGFTVFIGLGICCLYEVLNLLRKYVKGIYQITDKEKNILLWSAIFQIFVLTYSFTGLPHFDFEINTIYLMACAVPGSIMFKYKNTSKR